MALQVWLPLDGNLRNLGLDDSFQNFSLNNLIQDNSGKIGKCYSGNAIYHLSKEFLLNEWSLALWVKATSWATNNDILLCKNTSAATACQFYLSVINGKTFNLGINAGSTTGSYSYTFSTNTWYHLAATYNGTQYKLYINGSLVKEANYSSSLLTGHLNLGIGCRSTNVGGTSLTGYSGTKYYNDIRIYDHALSAKEVKELSKGLILHYRLSKPMPNLLKDGAIEISCRSKNGDYPLKAISTTLTNGTKYTVSFEAKSLNGLGTFYCSLALGGSSKTIFATQIKPTLNYQKYNFTATQGSASVNNVLFAAYYGWNNNANVTDTIYIKNVKLEEGELSTSFIPNESDTLYSAMGYDSNIELDCAPAGNQNDGTIVGTITAAADSPRYESSYHFASGANYINFSDFPKDALKDSYTFSWWEKGLKSSNMPWGFLNGNRLNVYHMNPICWNTGNGTSNPFQIDANTNLSSTTLCDNNWHHVAVTGDGSVTNIYIDGEYKAKAKTYLGITGTNLFLSGWDTGSGYKINDGYLSDFRIYCTALSAEDIKELYNTAAQVDKDGNIYAYEFKE